MSLAGKRIIVDAGHGGKYPGTIDNAVHKNVEKEIALKVAKLVQSKLVALGATVYMTRTTDKDFGGVNADDDVNKRWAYINANIPSSHALVSIHLNAVGGRVGSFYQEGTYASKSFAESIQKACTRYYDAFGCYAANFAILREVKVADQKSLIEIAQIDDPEIALSSRQSTIASAIVTGIQNQLK
ncbi:N-acetylmuramoyl-L-alanine amidase family protein [Paenibacillus dakarensis]|uniref:N-acetylmuramoyl-L-alanine amidase family protein n=1 Tax=Paenibacillus dakarensis TaxID=1527293 RepID=UPI0006D53A4B|nr:N-acetylmuramoyl-L-alanine amidase [Paenibacillus dakarensis]